MGQFDSPVDGRGKTTIGRVFIKADFFAQGTKKLGGSIKSASIIYDNNFRINPLGGFKDMGKILFELSFTIPAGNYDTNGRLIHKIILH
jgi:hypothetical protein